jgi:hypothetical protein
MSSYLNQVVVRQQISELISASEHGRIRRQFRDARRAARAARREARLAADSVDNGAGHWAHRIGYA